MGITKLRKAVNREHTCGECKGTITKGSSYYDTDIKLTKKPFPTLKYCVICGDKVKGQKTI